MPVEIWNGNIMVSGSGAGSNTTWYTTNVTSTTAVGPYSWMNLPASPPAPQGHLGWLAAQVEEVCRKGRLG